MSPYRSLQVEYQLQTQAATYEIQATGVDGRPGKPLVAARTAPELEQWLAQQARGQHATTGPKTILRLVHAHCNLRSDEKDPLQRRFCVTLPEALCLRLRRDLDLPADFGDYLGQVSDRVLRRSDDPSGTISYIVNSRADPEDTGCMLLGLTHSPNTHTTAALLLTTRTITPTDLEPILNALLPTTSLPLSLLTALTDLHIGLAVEVTQAVDTKLTELEAVESSFQDMIARPEGLTTISVLRSRVRSTIGRTGRRLANLAVLLDMHLQHQQPSSVTQQRPDVRHDAALAALSTHVENQRRDVRHLQHQTTIADLRMQTQWETVFQYMSQRDASAARSIAIATMRDGAAMKALALLTTVFLPGTYLATMFSMPVVDWEHASSLPGGAFGLYWIVTISLTVVVLAIWAVWTWRVEVRTRRVPQTWA